METTNGLPPTGDPDNDNLQRDEHGNAIGGIRSPHVEVPIATLRGRVPNAGPGSCSAFGATFPFSAEKLAQLYRNHGAFVSQWNQAVDTTVAAGFFTPEDGELIKASAATSSIGKRK
jgi:Alpha/beta hydrolase domain